MFFSSIQPIYLFLIYMNSSFINQKSLKIQTHICQQTIYLKGNYYSLINNNTNPKTQSDTIPQIKISNIIQQQFLLNSYNKVQMKSYLKSLTKTIYQKVQRVVQDEYIQPISQSQVYAIINRKRRSSFSLKSDKKHNAFYNKQSYDNQQLSIIQNIQRLGLVTPQRQFMLIGESYNLQVVNYRLKQLKTKIQAVKQYMLNNYEHNLQSIQKALDHLQDVKILHKSKLKAQMLRERLDKLKETVDRTKKITKLNIKIKNIKQTLKILQKVPNLKKMNLFQLKSINLQEVSQFKLSLKTLQPNSSNNKTPPLQCIQHIEQFIDRAASEHLRQVISHITQLLIKKFEPKLYQKTLKDFVIAKSKIEYQKLVVRLIQSQVRDNVDNDGFVRNDLNKNDSNKNDSNNSNNNINNNNNRNSISKDYSSMDLSHYANLMFTLCQKYIAILINLSKLLRFHRYSHCAIDKSQLDPLIGPRNQSNVSNSSQQQIGHPILNLQSQPAIHINTQQVKSLTCALMDQCLKQQIQQILLNQNILNQQIFQVLSLVNNFYQIAFSFTSYIFTQSKSTINQFLMRKCYKLHQKGLKKLNQSLHQQEENQWNRLPVPDNYRYKNLQRSIQKIKRLHLMQKVPHLYCNNFKFLNIQNNQSDSSQSSFQLQIAQSNQQTFQLNEIQFPYDKLQKVLSIETSDSQLPQHQDPVVVMCQSSIIILAYFDKFMQMYCYYPIQEIRQNILNKMTFYIEYYIYYLFETFLSQMYKKFFEDQHGTIEQTYHHVRFKNLYKEVYEFVKSYKERQISVNFVQNKINGVNPTSHRRKQSIDISKYKTKGFLFVKSQIAESQISQQNGVKARAIATDSIKYLLAYFAHILGHLQKYTQPSQNEDDNQSQMNKNKNILTKYTQKLQRYKIIQQQLNDLLLTDIVQVSTRIDFVVPIMKKIKWNQLQSSKEISEYGSMIMKNVRQVYEKLKSMSKGSMPFYIVDKIFSFYWKTQLTYITKTFLQDHIAQKQKGGKVSKLAFEKLVDVLHEGIVQIIDSKSRSSQHLIESSKKILTNYSSLRQQMFKSSYLKIKSIFPIILQTDWQQCKQLIEQLFTKYEFIYKITFNIMRASECCSGLSANDIQQRVKQVQQSIVKMIAS